MIRSFQLRLLNKFVAEKSFTYAQKDIQQIDPLLQRLLVLLRVLEKSEKQRTRIFMPERVPSVIWFM